MTDWNDFLVAVKKLKVGESFVFPRLMSNHRLALAIAPRWIDARFQCVAEGKSFRIGRIQ